MSEKFGKCECGYIADDYSDAEQHLDTEHPNAGAPGFATFESYDPDEAPPAE